MDVLSQSAFLRALGWSLLDSLWQMGILWLLFLAFTHSISGIKPRQKHALALLSVMGGTLWFVLDILLHYSGSYGSGSIPWETPAIADWFSGTRWPDTVNLLLPYVSLVYLGVIATLLFRFYNHYRFTRKVTRGGLHKLQGNLRVFIRTLTERMGIRKEVRAWISDNIDTPLTIGFWKPVILLPVAIMNNLSVKQAEAIILHELHHIRRNDFLVNILIAFTDIFLFFNPFARLFSESIRRERELCCDDMVLQFRYDPAEYSRALLALEQNRNRFPVLALPAAGKNRKMLLLRIRRMLNQRTAAPPASLRLMGFLFGALLIGCISWFKPLPKVTAGTPSTAQPLALNTLSLKTPEFPLRFSSDATTAAMKEKQKILIGKKKHEKTGIHEIIARRTPRVDNNETGAIGQDAETFVLMPAPVPDYTVSYEGSASGPLVTFANELANSEYSLLEASESAPVNSVSGAPYVPSGSFSYQEVEDTSQPKARVLNQSQAAALVDLEKALTALDAIDWTQVEQELGDNANTKLVEIRQAISNALKKVDWEKVNVQVEKEMKAALTEAGRNYQVQLARYQQLHRLQQLKLQQLRENLINERISSGNSESADSADCNSSSSSSQKKTRVRKIIIL